MSEFEVRFYETLQGRVPAEEFICEQNVKMRARIYRSIELLELKGNSLREPYSRETLINHSLRLCVVTRSYTFNLIDAVHCAFFGFTRRRSVATQIRKKALISVSLRN